MVFDSIIGNYFFFVLFLLASFEFFSFLDFYQRVEIERERETTTTTTKRVMLASTERRADQSRREEEKILSNQTNKEKNVQYDIIVISIEGTMNDTRHTFARTLVKSSLKGK